MEERRTITDREKNEKYVKEITMTDQQKSIKITLWDAAAANFNHNLGTLLMIMDAAVTYNTHYNETMLSVNYPDQIQVNQSIHSEKKKNSNSH